MSDNLLQINNLYVGFKQGEILKPAVSGISLAINRGETVTLLGESGCGKSLTSLSIMQLLPPAAQYYGKSEIILDGQNLLTLSEVQMGLSRFSQSAVPVDSGQHRVNF